MGLIQTTYEIITEESAADGEAAESGYLDEVGTPYTVHEAIALLRGTTWTTEPVMWSASPTTSSRPAIRVDGPWRKRRPCSTV